MFISKHILHIAEIKYCMNCFLLEGLLFSGLNIVILVVSRIFPNTSFSGESWGTTVILHSVATSGESEYLRE